MQLTKILDQRFHLLQTALEELSYDIVKVNGGELKMETKESEEMTFIIQLLNVEV